MSKTIESNPISPPKKENTFYIASLDGIRALAFLLVFLAHSVLNANGGMFGVCLFFFLSGFLITTLLRRENDKHGQISVKKFYIRRILRIFPPLYITIALVLALTWLNLLPGTRNLGAILAACTFTTNYFEILRGQPLGGLSVLWSLAVEEHFYLVFPFVFFWMNRKKIEYKRQAVILGMVCFVVLLWRILLQFFLHGEDIHLEYGTDTRIDMILFGCILALAANPLLDKDATPKKPMVWLGLLAIAATFAIRNKGFHNTLGFTMQGIAFLPLFSFAIVSAQTACVWLNFKFVRLVGTLSYSLYLVHLAMLEAFTADVHSKWIAIGSALAVSALYAYVMNVAVERPLAKIRRQLDAGRN